MTAAFLQTAWLVPLYPLVAAVLSLLWSPGLIKRTGPRPCGYLNLLMVTVAFGLRNMADYPAALREMLRVLKPGGRLVILDFSLPGGLLRAPYRLYLHHVLPRMAGWLTRQRDAYEYLGGSIEAFPSGKAMTGLLESCGFAETRATPLTGGVVSIYEGTRPAL